MTTQNEELQRIADETAQSWYGPNVDTVTLTAENRAHVEKLKGTKKSVEWNDFGQIDRVHQKFVTDNVEFSEEDVAELARRDPAFRTKWDEAQMEETTLAFVRSEKHYLSTDRNFRRMVQHMGKIFLDVPNLDPDDGIAELYKVGAWTVPNLAAAFKVLSKAGQLEVESGMYRELTKAEKLAVISDVRMGDLDAAINRYIWFAFDGTPPPIGRGRDFAAAHPELLGKASWFLFAEMHAGELSFEELTAFKKHMSRCSLPTVTLLEKSFMAWRESEPLRRAASVQNSPEPTTTKPPHLTLKEIEKLSDAEINELIREEERQRMRERYA